MAASESNRSATHHYAPSLEFNLPCVEGGLDEMNLSPVVSDHKSSIGPPRIFLGADQEFQG